MLKEFDRLIEWFFDVKAQLQCWMRGSLKGVLNDCSPYQNNTCSLFLFHYLFIIHSCIYLLKKISLSYTYPWRSSLFSASSLFVFFPFLCFYLSIRHDKHFPPRYLLFFHRLLFLSPFMQHASSFSPSQTPFIFLFTFLLPFFLRLHTLLPPLNTWTRFNKVDRSRWVWEYQSFTGWEKEKEREREREREWEREREILVSFCCGRGGQTHHNREKSYNRVK